MPQNTACANGPASKCGVGEPCRGGVDLFLVHLDSLTFLQWIWVRSEEDSLCRRHREEELGGHSACLAGTKRWAWCPTVCGGVCSGSWHLGGGASSISSLRSRSSWFLIKFEAGLGCVRPWPKWGKRRPKGRQTCPTPTPACTVPPSSLRTAGVVGVPGGRHPADPPHHPWVPSDTELVLLL